MAKKNPHTLNTDHHPTLSCGHKVLYSDQVHYCSYIQDPLIHEMLHPKDSVGVSREYTHPDEFQFIIVHQSCELSFSGCLFEIERVIHALKERRLQDASDLIDRCRSWLLISARQLQHLVEHLTPEDFAFFRIYLSPASGAESIRFRLIEIASGIGPQSPYVEHRGHTFSFKEFLDRGPSEGEGRPKTCWWTEAMERRAQEPTLASAFYDLCHTIYKEVGAKELSGAKELNRAEELSGAKEASGTEETREIIKSALLGRLGEDIQVIAESLYKYERSLRTIRKVHLNAARKHVKEEAGTGHTDGVFYLRSVLKTAQCFPLLTELAEELIRSPEIELFEGEL